MPVIPEHRTLPEHTALSEHTARPEHPALSGQKAWPDHTALSEHTAWPEHRPSSEHGAGTRPEHGTRPDHGAGPEHEAGRLAALIARVAAGQSPPPDGGVTILPQPSPRDAGVLSLTAHAVIFTDAGPGFDRWVRAQLPDGDLAAPMSPQFLQALGAHTGRRASTIDMPCLARPR